jgi:hypothetical protein
MRQEVRAVGFSGSAVWLLFFVGDDLSKAVWLREKSTSDFLSTQLTWRSGVDNVSIDNFNIERNCDMDTPEPAENAQPVQDVDARENTEVNEIVNAADVADTEGDEKSEESEASSTSKDVTPVDEDKKIDAAVKFINETANKMVYKGSIEIGEYILKHFFDNDMSLASSKSPIKKESYRKLCQREDLVVSPMLLLQMVRVASQEKFLEAKTVETAGLSYTHKASLTRLENDEKKIRLINSCIKNDWSTRQLDKKIDAKLKQLVSNTELSLIRKTSSYLKAIDKFPELEASLSEKGTSMIANLKPKQRESLEKKLNALKAGTEEISKKSEALTSFCDTLLEGLAAAAAKDQSDGEQDKEVFEKPES